MSSNCFILVLVLLSPFVFALDNVPAGLNSCAVALKQTTSLADSLGSVNGTNEGFYVCDRNPPVTFKFTNIFQAEADVMVSFVSAGYVYKSCSSSTGTQKYDNDISSLVEVTRIHCIFAKK